MISLQEYIVEVSSELIKRAANKAEQLSKTGSHREREFRTQQAKRLYKQVQPQTWVELRELMEDRLKKDKNADLNDIDVSNIKYMEGLFVGLDPHNIKIDKWDVSKVTDMGGMFSYCRNFEGKGLENWDVSNVTTFHLSIFILCGSNS